MRNYLQQYINGFIISIISCISVPVCISLESALRTPRDTLGPRLVLIALRRFPARRRSFPRANSEANESLQTMS